MFFTQFRAFFPTYELSTLTKADLEKISSNNFSTTTFYDISQPTFLHCDNFKSRFSQTLRFKRLCFVPIRFNESRILDFVNKGGTYFTWYFPRIFSIFFSSTSSFFSLAFSPIFVSSFSGSEANSMAFFSR